MCFETCQYCGAMLPSNLYRTDAKYCCRKHKNAALRKRNAEGVTLDGKRNRGMINQSQAPGQRKEHCSMNFTEHIKRIKYLADQSLVHAKAGKFTAASDDLFNISDHSLEARQQLDDMSLTAYQGKDPAKSLEGGPQP